MPVYEIYWTVEGVESIEAANLAEALQEFEEMPASERAVGMDYTSAVEISGLLPIHSFSIGDDDICSHCLNCTRSYTDRPSKCLKDWPGMENEDNTICHCGEHMEGEAEIMHKGG